MKIKQLIAAGFSVAVFAQALAAPRLYQESEIPEPRDVASFFCQCEAESGAAGVRAIRMVKPGQAPAPAVQLTKVAPARPATLLVNGEMPDSLALPIQFQFDSARILPLSFAQLDAMAEGIKLAGADAKVAIEGHTDAAGNSDYNLSLSLRRARAVKEYLVKVHGITAENLSVVGMGSSQPLNKSNPYARENRRVEFRIERA